MKTAVRTMAAALALSMLFVGLWILRPSTDPTPREVPATVRTETPRAAPEPDAAPPAPTVSEQSARLHRGLAWLAKHQADDGSWHDPATTGIALLAFLGAGETNHNGSHRDTVRRALRYLMSVQREDGGLARDDSPSPLREHAIAGLALVEAFGMTGSRPLEEPAQRAVGFALRARIPGSGWSAGGAVDAESTGWMAMLIKSAKMSELQVDTTVLTEAAAALDAFTDAETGRLISRRGSLSDAAATAMAMWVRRLSGRADDPVAPRAAKTLVAAAAGPGLDDEAWYLGTIAVWHECGAEWQNWKDWMRVRLPAVDWRQRTDADAAVRGSWDPPGASTSDTDRVWSTALSLLGSYPYVCNWYPRTLSPRGSR